MTENDNISVKIVILGEPAVGKTTLRINFIGKGMEGDNYLMTLGADLSESTIEISEKITLDAQIWDIAGQDNFAPIIGEYLRGAQGAILVFDMTRSYTFDEITKWLDRLHKANPELENNIPFIIVGNKADLNNFYDYDEEKVKEFISYVNRHELYSKTPVQHVNTSAKTGFAVQEAFRKLGKTIIRNFLELGREIDGVEDLFDDVEASSSQVDTEPDLVPEEDEEEQLVRPSDILRKQKESQEQEATSPITSSENITSDRPKDQSLSEEIEEDTPDTVEVEEERLVKPSEMFAKQNQEISKVDEAELESKEEQTPQKSAMADHGETLKQQVEENQETKEETQQDDDMDTMEPETEPQFTETENETFPDQSQMDVNDESDPEQSDKLGDE